jgi:hypothetical protein
MISFPAPNSDGPAWSRAPWLPLILFVATLAARAQTFGNPVIELDEQLYRLIGERMLDGGVPYVELFDTKPVGLFLLFALAALIGGAHALSYQLMASLGVFLTAWAVHAMARRVCAGQGAPLIAALLYICWLNLLQGEGGQASVLYNAPVAIAALLTLRQALGERPGKLLRDGALIMALLGLAIQLKYTVAIEGVFFGLVLLWSGWRSGTSLVRLAGYGLLWASLALLPTALAWGAFAALGHADAWYFANFVSVSRRAPMPLPNLIDALTGSLAAMSLLILAALLGWRQRPRGHAGMMFALGWLIMAIAALLAVFSFGVHYWIPLLLPLLVLAAPAFEAMRRAAIGLTLVAAMVSQGLVAFLIHSKGTARTVEHMIAAMGPLPNCVFVFDGFPALYQEADSCLPSRFLFPNMLNGALLVDALGVDPDEEVERIMATRPSAVVLDEPRWSLRNRATNAIVDRELAAHYTLVLREETGKGRFRLVYRVKPGDARP